MGWLDDCNILIIDKNTIIMSSNDSLFKINLVTHKLDPLQNQKD